MNFNSEIVYLPIKGRFGGLFYCPHIPEPLLRSPKKSFAKASWQVSKSAHHHADKGFTHLAKWATTDHTGFSRAMAEMPKMGFIDGIKYILTHFVIMLIGTFISMVLIFILIAFGIPIFIQLLLH